MQRNRLLRTAIAQLRSCGCGWVEGTAVAPGAVSTAAARLHQLGRAEVCGVARSLQQKLAKQEACMEEEFSFCAFCPGNEAIETGAFEKQLQHACPACQPAVTLPPQPTCR